MRNGILVCISPFCIMLVLGCGTENPLEEDVEDAAESAEIAQQEDALDPQSFGSFFEFQQARQKYLEQLEDDETREELEAMTDEGALRQAYAALDKVSVRREAAQKAAEASGDFSKIMDTYYTIIWEELGMKKEIRLILSRPYVSAVRHQNRQEEKEQLRLWSLLGHRRSAESERHLMENVEVMDDLIAAYLMFTIAHPLSNEIMDMYTKYIFLGGAKMRFPDFKKFPELADQFEDVEPIRFEDLIDQVALAEAQDAVHRVSQRRAEEQKKAEAKADDIFQQFLKRLPKNAAEREKAQLKQTADFLAFRDFRETYEAILSEELGMEDHRWFRRITDELEDKEAERYRLLSILLNKKGMRFYMEYVSYFDDLLIAYMMFSIANPDLKAPQVYLKYSEFVELGGAKVNFPDFRTFPELVEEEELRNLIEELDKKAEE